MPKKYDEVPPAVLRLFQEERGKSVDAARDRLALATSHASQADAEAKRLWGFVRDGFVAQKQAESADVAARDAAMEQTVAQKAMDDARHRQLSARKDLEEAMREAASNATTMTLATKETLSPAFQALPGAYRLSLLGSQSAKITLQNGTIVRRLDPNVGEAEAWLVVCPDPAKLRLGIGSQRADVIVRPLPASDLRSKV